MSPASGIAVAVGTNLNDRSYDAVWAESLETYPTPSRCATCYDTVPGWLFYLKNADEKNIRGWLLGGTSGSWTPDNKKYNN